MSLFCENILNALEQGSDMPKSSQASWPEAGGQIIVFSVVGLVTSVIVGRCKQIILELSLESYFGALFTLLLIDSYSLSTWNCVCLDTSEKWVSISPQENNSFLSDYSRIRILLSCFIIKGLDELKGNLNWNMEKEIVMNVVGPFFSWPTEHDTTHSELVGRARLNNLPYYFSN